MSLERIVSRRISKLTAALEVAREDETLEQVSGLMEEKIEYLKDLLREAKEPVMEQEVQVHLTLTVNADVSKEDIEGRFRALVLTSGEMELLDLRVQEEAEIYGNE